MMKLSELDGLKKAVYFRATCLKHFTMLKKFSDYEIVKESVFTSHSGIAFANSKRGKEYLAEKEQGLHADSTVVYNKVKGYEDIVDERNGVLYLRLYPMDKGANTKAVYRVYHNGTLIDEGDTLKDEYAVMASKSNFNSISGDVPMFRKKLEDVISIVQG